MQEESVYNCCRFSKFVSEDAIIYTLLLQLLLLSFRCTKISHYATAMLHSAEHEKGLAVPPCVLSMRLIVPTGQAIICGRAPV